MTELRLFTGDAILAALDDLARLRIAVFAAWPYLYEGDIEYERLYLREFAAAPQALIVAACEGGVIVGAATASLMSVQKEEISQPFKTVDGDISRYFYFGESVLLPEWRGQGIGHAFFDHRENHARACGARCAAFAAVIRAADHPARPAGYVPLDAFWRKRGYAPVPGAVMNLSWKDHGETQESGKPLQCWTRRL